MSADEGRPPVIIIGMHRSGTGLVARMLDRLGLFQGWRRQSDHEPLFFLGLNDWLLRQSGGAWDRPEAVHDLLQNRAVRTLALDYLRASLASPRCISFLGPGGFLRYRTLARLDMPWGWKDPRSTFTLPLWLEIFPSAKVVHVFRHGADVAQSLRERDQRILERRAARYERLKPIYSLRAKKRGFVTSLRCTSLDRGFSLWETYMKEARCHLAGLGERGLEVRYESLLAEPSSVLDGIVTFCAIDAPELSPEDFRGEVEPQRAFAYRDSAELREFAGSVSARLEAFGY